jgi:hypothetical protein
MGVKIKTIRMLQKRLLAMIWYNVVKMGIFFVGAFIQIPLPIKSQHKGNPWYRIFHYVIESNIISRNLFSLSFSISFAAAANIHLL